MDEEGKLKEIKFVYISKLFICLLNNLKQGEYDISNYKYFIDNFR